MPRGVPIPRSEVSEILRLYHTARKQDRPLMEIYEEIGEITGHPTLTIQSLIKRLSTTTDLAGAFLKAGALKMSRRLVAKATTAEIIDIFSRSNIGVLAPKQEAEGKGGGFFLSIQSDSLGGVKVGLASSPGRLTLPEGDSSERSESAAKQRARVAPMTSPVISSVVVEKVEEPPPSIEGLTQAPTVCRNKKTQKAIEAAQERLATPPKQGRRNNYKRTPPKKRPKGQSHEETAVSPAAHPPIPIVGSD